MGQADVLYDLRRIAWGDMVDVPCGEISTRLRHDYAEFAYPYSDAADHEWMGRARYEVSARLYFVNTLIGEGANLYPEQWATFLSQAKTGHIWALEHPDPNFGDIEARCTEVNFVLDPNVTSGTIADVTWIETMAKGIGVPILNLDTLYCAQIADYFMDELIPSTWSPTTMDSITYYFDPSPTALTGVSVSSLTDIWGQIKSQAFSASLTFQGACNKFKAVIQEINEFIDPDTNPLLLPLVDALDALEEAIDQEILLAEAGARPTNSKTLAHDMTHSAVADATKNDINDIFDLNPSTLRFAIIPKGTSVLYYTNVE